MGATCWGSGNADARSVAVVPLGVLAVMSAEMTIACRVRVEVKDPPAPADFLRVTGYPCRQLATGNCPVARMAAAPIFEGFEFVIVA